MNREETNRKGREYRAKLKQERLDAYGSQCACCGESEPKFLTVDHIYNDAHMARKLGKYANGLNFHLWLKRNGYPKGDVQTLCWNCNGGKRVNNGVCPHKSKLPAPEVM